ncbi:MAG: hypothetical protein KDA91_06875 [Planctomycetaceae bacterium]|nr:hypothetical protein [Planctomycetaceae bacterium]
MADSGELRRRWSKYVPQWRDQSVLVVETGTEFSGALSLQIQSSGQLNLAIRCTSCHSLRDVREQLNMASVCGVVFDLVSRAAESLTVLRFLSGQMSVPSIAIGHSEHAELLPVLLEAGCSTLLTTSPFERDVEQFLRRALASRASGSSWIR